MLLCHLCLFGKCLLRSLGHFSIFFFLLLSFKSSLIWILALYYNFSFANIRILPICDLSSHSLGTVICRTEIFILMMPSLSFISWIMSLVSCLKNDHHPQYHLGFFLCLYSRNFIVLHVTFMFVTHFELMKGIRLV